MPAITRLPDQQDERFPFVAEYECQCGKKMTIFAEDSPRRLSKCWQCIEREGRKAGEYEQG